MDEELLSGGIDHLAYLHPNGYDDDDDDAAARSSGVVYTRAQADLYQQDCSFEMFVIFMPRSWEILRA